MNQKYTLEERKQRCDALIRCIALGLSSRQIEAELRWTPNEVSNGRAFINSKTGLQDTREWTLYAIQQKLVTLEEVLQTIPPVSIDY